MFSLNDLPQTLPVFPLPGALLLPRTRLPLHIFEPRYLQMIEDCMKTRTRLIAMVQPCPSRGEKHLNKIGCAGRLTSFSETEDGRYMITLTGISRFRLGDECTGFSPYPRHDVHWADFKADLHKPDRDPTLDRSHFLPLLGRYFEEESLETDWDSLDAADDELLINSLSMLCPFSPEDKQALLEAPCLKTRRETLVTLLEFSLRGGSNEDIM